MTHFNTLKLAAILFVARWILRYWSRLELTQRLTLGEADFDVRARVSTWLIRCASIAGELDHHLENPQS